MSDWEQYTKGKIFISDLSAAHTLPGLSIASFAVWQPTKELDKHQIVEVSNDLNYLKDKYHVEEPYVFRIAK